MFIRYTAQLLRNNRTRSLSLTFSLSHLLYNLSVFDSFSVFNFFAIIAMIVCTYNIAKVLNIRQEVKFGLRTKVIQVWNEKGVS